MKNNLEEQKNKESLTPKSFIDKPSEAQEITEPVSSNPEEKNNEIESQKEKISKIKPSISDSPSLSPKKTDDDLIIDGKPAEEYFEREYFYGETTKGKKDVRSNYQGSFNYEIWNNNRFWKPLVDKVQKMIISKEIGNQKVLDIGCAFGFFAKRLQPHFQEVHGLDISKDAVERAKKELPEGKFDTCNLNNQELPFADKTFDLITALDVLEHTKDMKNSLKKIIPKLKDDGRLIISVPVKGTWGGWLFGKFDKDKSHISVLPQNQLFKIISELQLEVVDKKYFFNSGLFRWYNPVFAPDIEIMLKKTSDESKNI